MADLNNREKARVQLIRGGGYWKTICEIFRLLYDKIENMEDKTLKEEIVELLIDGIIMGNKMYKRLAYYQRKYEDDTGSQGKKLLRMPNMYKLRKQRRQRAV